MKILNQHLKSGHFKQVYLLYGSEDYLRHQYRDRLKKALAGDGDTMNCNYYEGKDISVPALIDMSETLPFFASRRLIIVEDSGFFTSAQDELAEYIKSLPETTYMVFVERDVDKRNKLYKWVSKQGYAACLDRPDERMLAQWIRGILKKEGRFMSDDTLKLFLGTVDTDMENVRGELEKLVLFTDGRETIAEDDIRAVCTVHTENKIFEMISAVAGKRQARALELYQDLLTLREPPMRVLYLITRQFNQLFQLKELLDKGYPVHVAAERMGIREFIVRKNASLCQYFSLAELRRAVESCVEAETRIKTGQIGDQIAVELLILRFSSK